MTTAGSNSGLLSECYGFRMKVIILDTCWKESFFGAVCPFLFGGGRGEHILPSPMLGCSGKEKLPGS